MKTSLLARVATATRRQWILVACILSVGGLAALGALLFIHPKYTATTSVVMVPQSSATSSLLSISASGTEPLRAADLPLLATDPTVLERLRGDIGETASVEKLRLRVRAKVSPDSAIMPVEYTAGSPEKAVRGANALAEEIVRFYRGVATSRFDSLIADFTAQLVTRRAELSVLDGQLASAARQYPYIDVNVPGAPAVPASSVYGHLIELRSERDTLSGAMEADAAAARATSRLIDDAAPLAERDIVNNDSAYRNLLEQFAKDFSTLQKLRAFGSDRYPGIVELRATVRREEAMTASERRQAASAGPASNPVYVAALDARVKADAQYSSDRARVRTANDQLERLNAQIGEGRIATGVARIRRDRGAVEAAYSAIAERLAKAIADRAEAASTGSVIILDRARFAPPVVFASGAFFALGILFLSVWSALTLAVMIDGTYEQFDDADTVELVYGSKLIGSIA
jgi:uncharacterized protein involved in exopolysaccharide biosynthesis